MPTRFIEGGARWSSWIPLRSLIIAVVVLVLVLFAVVGGANVVSLLMTIALVVFLLWAAWGLFLAIRAMCPRFTLTYLVVWAVSTIVLWLVLVPILESAAGSFYGAPYAQSSVPASMPFVTVMTIVMIATRIGVIPAVLGAIVAALVIRLLDHRGY